MASLLAIKTEPKVVKFDSSAKFIFITTFGPVLLYIEFPLTSWFQIFFIYYHSFHMQGCTLWFFWVPQMYIKPFSKPEENWIFFKNFKKKDFSKYFFIIILCNSCFIDSPRMMISSVVVDLLEWKVLYWNIFPSGVVFLNVEN